MALSANRELNRYVDQELRSFSVAASEHIWKGAFVGVDRATGYVRNLQSGDDFAGIAYEEVDNSGGSGGATSIRLYTQGDFILAASSAAQTLIGAPVYASDNESTTVTATPGLSEVGILMAVVGTNLGVVRIQPLGSGLVEHAKNALLTSSTSAATMNPVLIPQRAIRIISAQVSFLTAPNSGNLDVGTTTAAPNEIVAAFNLATLSANTPASLTLAGRTVAKNVPIWAKVGQASSTAGTGGLLSLRYVELP